MKTKKIHIVSLDVPFPADYGGAIDIYYRIKALHDLGLEVELHTFEYGRGKQPELDKIAKVNYYKRKRGVFSNLSRRPYIVQSRINRDLEQALLMDNAPILFEGIHTTYYLENEKLSDRFTMVRMHNLEDEYYAGLMKNASFFKRLFFSIETQKLKKYQRILEKANHVLAIKKTDALELEKINPNVSVLPASIPEIQGKYQAAERYALFHGNLSVPENHKAAMWLIKTLKPILRPEFDFVIAGKSPSRSLKSACQKNDIELVENPSKAEMEKLIQEAQIHTLYTPLQTGIKLKLLNCMVSSGHILANSKMINGTHLEEFCVEANDPKTFKMHFVGLQSVTLEEKDFIKRKTFIDEHFNTKKNCIHILSLLENSTVH